MTLHKAMVEVLRDRGGDWMDRDELAREIARRDLFRRPSDGAAPPSEQLRLRARRYSRVFECSGTRCTRIRLRPGSGESDTSLGRAKTQTSRAHSPSHAAQSMSAGAPSPHQGRAHPGAGAIWYEEPRRQYRPAQLRVLLIAESPPDPGAGERRFFYAPRLTIDNLYRGVAQALYGDRSDIDVSDKLGVLERLHEDGFWLIDAVDKPINKLAAAARTRAISEAVPSLVERCGELAPDHGVIICHGKVYAAAAPALRGAGVRVLHDEPLPIPARHVAKAVRGRLPARGRNGGGACVRSDMNRCAGEAAQSA